MITSLFKKPLLSAVLLGTFIQGTSAVTLKLTVRNPDFGPKSKTPCPRGDPSDSCTITSYLYSGPTSGRNNTAPVFRSGWKGFQQDHKGWKLEDGGALQGEIEIWIFNTFNNCPSTAGVEVRASFHPVGNDPQNWIWSQALNDNYDVKVTPPHNSAPHAPIEEMDGPKPPGYPEAQGQDFYDKSGYYCFHNSTIYFHAVALVSKIDRQAKKLTTYEGFEYGWEYSCKHSPVPEPASFISMSLGLATLGIGVRRHKRKIISSRALAVDGDSTPAKSDRSVNTWRY